MKNKDILKKLKIKPVSGGFTRQWIRCKKCKNVYYRDYTAFGIGNPITFLPCGHDFGMRFFDAVDVVSETIACKKLVSQLRNNKPPA